ncbi:MAG: hypothetical protein Ta2B_19050 [Termitinemataceae bacterium]|nr:MAG: hypothetical protein Ta2B_19050 [Termitinemataceae bacterium]
MEKFPLYRWWKAQEIEKIFPETLLKSREKYCVAACSRFLTMNFIKDHAWVLSCGGQSAAAMILHSRKTLFPVFNGQTEFFTPTFLLRALKNIDIYAIQGLKKETETLEKILMPLGFSAREYKDFNLMFFNKSQKNKITKAPKHLTLRRAILEDGDKIMPLQELYEKEEVLPEGNTFNRSVSRLNLAEILKKQQCLVAEIDGRIVGKINTNAQSFSCAQLGGVFVLPEFRGLGIASCMVSLFTDMLSSSGKDITLNVKKQNIKAQIVYKKCGFKKIADYRTVYMQE